jgi:hypothetical protein
MSALGADPEVVQLLFFMIECVILESAPQIFPSTESGGLKRAMLAEVVAPLNQVCGLRFVG